ncbi:MAG: hypothetical protein QOJ06_351 [Pseudonocardiales bacterium]|jgi:hypothetical protein|nr:hypothetical protein [Pseudonocardiales bacterium]
MRHEDERGGGRVRRPDHWVYLDRWWAQRLGVTRTAGVYRIRSRELARRLSQERLGVDASGTVFAYGTRPAATSSNNEKRLETRNSHATVSWGVRGRSRVPGGEST